MSFQKSHSSVKDPLTTARVLQKSVEKSLALELENSKLQQHSKITAAFCPSCSDNHNQVDCADWVERVEEEEKRLEKVEFAGGEDVEPLVIEEAVAVVAEKRYVVRRPVAVAESVAGAEVAEDVAMVEVVGKGKEVVVVAEEAQGSVGSQEEDWTVVKRRVRVSSEDRRRKV
ncbi:hypothetical protein HOY80DRAFT_1048715 [Tuber brumale]|nr:hypothetical protein HOY80DRAFT_1048715 [Tuber brumale]